jgi:CBS domain-containing protein
MTTKPIMVPIDASIQECCRIMSEKDVGSLIIHKNRKMQGIVTEEDIVRKAALQNWDMKKTRIADIMSTNIIHITPERDVHEAILLMKNHDIRTLPVLDGGKLVGILTLKDVLKIEPQLFEILMDSAELRAEDEIIRKGYG